MVRTPGRAELGGTTGVTDSAQSARVMESIVAAGNPHVRCAQGSRAILSLLALAIGGNRVHHYVTGE